MQPATPSDDTAPLDAAVAPLCSLSLYCGRATGPVVGRTREMEAIRQALAAGQGGMACAVLEGEPGIGKSRMLMAIEELAAAQGMIPVAVTADEEIRGPFLLARSVFACPSVAVNVAGKPAAGAVARAIEALSDRSDSSLASMSSDLRLVRVFDLAAIALRAVAAVRPLALLEPSRL